jgi:hypothetical protein
MAKSMDMHEFGADSAHMGGEPGGHDSLPGHKVSVGHGPVMDGFEQKHLNHQVHGRISHSPRSLFHKHQGK